MSERHIKLVAIQTAPEQGIDFDPWGDWPSDLVLFEAAGHEAVFEGGLPDPTQTLGRYLASGLRPRTVGAEQLAAQVVSKAAERVGPWIDEAGANVTVALEANEAGEYMTLVVTDEPCRRVVRLRIEFHDDPND